MVVSRPTFAELTDALAKNGMLDAINDEGDIEIGNLVIRGDASVRQNVRLAAAIDEATAKPPCCAGDACYEDGDVAIYAKCRPDAVHLIERRPGLDARVVTLPRESLTSVAGGLIECMANPTD